MNKGLSRITVLTVIAAIMLSGCKSRTSVDNAEHKAVDKTDKGITVSNNVSPDEGRVLICTEGYEKNGSKKALIQDMKGAESFEVIDVRTEKAVLSDRVKYRKDNTENEAAVGICDFTSLDKPGSFYIRINTGRVSNVFTVEENIYKKLLSDKMSSLGEEDKVSGGYSDDNIGECFMRITDYLLAQEFFPDSISPAVNGDARVIPRTTLLARAEIDELKDYIRENGTFIKPFADEIGRQYLYSAVFALFAYEYREYDDKYSRECADIAEKAYNTAEDTYTDSLSSDRKAVDDKRYWASAQLYKLTGKPVYRETTESYIADTPVGWNEEKYGYLGTLAYLTCYNRIDLNLSGQLITKLMDEINMVVRESLKGDYLIAEEDTSEIDDHVMDKLYENARLTVLGNYISKNIKYVECAENYLAYLYGRNMLGKDYAYMQDSEFYDEPQMFILAGLIDSYIYEDKQPKAMER